MKGHLKKFENQTEASGNRTKKFIIALSAAILLITGNVAVFINYSSKATEHAVNNIGLLYLEHLGSNANSLLTSNFDSYSDELRLAVLTTEGALTKTEADLKAHLSKIAERSGFLFYALLDEDGNVYISNERYLSEHLVNYLHDCDFDGQELTVVPGEDGEDIFVIAQATSHTTTILNGTKIVAAAQGVPETEVKEEILIKSTPRSTFTSLIKPDGTYIIPCEPCENKSLVGSDNLFTDMRNHCKFTSEYSLDNVIHNIKNEVDGSAAYYLGDELYYTHYSTLPVSGWVLTVALPATTASNSVWMSVSKVTLAGIILMLLMVAMVSILFWGYTHQKRVSMALNIQRMEAVEQNRAKSSFLSSMSHDIRTPMNAIIGFTNLAMQQDNPPKTQDFLNKISTSSNHLLSLINDILDMSRIESGKMTFDETKCNLADVLHGLHTIILGQVTAKQQRLYMDAVDVINENVWCDKMRLNQVLLNFLSNAVKFTPPGGTITVLVKQKACDRPGYGSYEFRVKDTGIGMSKEFSERIFEPFERERTVTVNNIQGTGLGMSIAKNIVDMMNGTIEVESEPGAGSEFIVNVDFRIQNQDELDESAALVPLETLRGMRALVVDDDFDTCDGITKMLHRLGIRSEWTMSGHEAVLRINQSKELGNIYDMLIIDWQLPDLNGLEVIRKIHNSTYEKVPILLISSYSWSDVEEEAIKAGVTAFCSKPLFMSDLHQLLQEIFSNPNESAKITKEVHSENFEGKRILLAEDNELNREIAFELLQGYGFVVDTAENGNIALEKIAASKPGYYDVVLMDINMPIMSGYEAAKAIRRLENPKLATVPILAMTANAFEEDKQNSLAAGMNGHITKPIDINVLLDVLKQHLQ